MIATAAASSSFPRTIPVAPTVTTTNARNTAVSQAHSSIILTILLKFVHLVYAVILFLFPLIQSIRKHGNDIARFITRSTIAQHSRTLHAKDFSRLPCHLAFSIGHSQLESKAASTLTETSVHNVATLLAKCCDLNIPEVTLFDEENLLSASVNAIAEQLAQLQSSSSASFRSSVLFIQTQRTEQTVYALFQGQSLLLDSAEIRPLVGQRPQMLEYLEQFELGTIQADSPVIVITLLAGRHSQQSIVDATISRERRGNQKPAIREILQSSLMTFPLTEPDLLIVIQQGSISNGHRSLVGFPPWLLRTTEILFVEGLQQLTSDAYEEEVFEERLQEFAKSVQRLGT